MSPPPRLCYGLLLTLFPTALAVCADLAKVAKNQSAYSCVGDKAAAPAPTWQDLMNTGIQTGMGFAMAGAPLERQSDSACCTPIACLQEGTICATSVSKPCPTEQPTANSACGASSEGLVCKYDLNCKENLALVVTGCYFITQAECTEAAWRVLQESSGPPERLVVGGYKGAQLCEADGTSCVPFEYDCATYPICDGANFPYFNAMAKASDTRMYFSSQNWAGTGFNGVVEVEISGTGARVVAASANLGGDFQVNSVTMATEDGKNYVVAATGPNMPSVFVWEEGNLSEVKADVKLGTSPNSGPGAHDAIVVDGMVYAAWLNAGVVAWFPLVKALAAAGVVADYATLADSGQTEVLDRQSEPRQIRSVGGALYVANERFQPVTGDFENNFFKFTIEADGSLSSPVWKVNLGGEAGNQSPAHFLAEILVTNTDLWVSDRIAGDTKSYLYRISLSSLADASEASPPVFESLEVGVNYAWGLAAASDGTLAFAGAQDTTLGFLQSGDLTCKQMDSAFFTAPMSLVAYVPDSSTGISTAEPVTMPSEHATCEPGKDFVSADGCNTCFCPDSGMKSMAACTEKACPTPASLCSLIRCSNEATDTVGSDCYNCYGGGCVDCSGRIESVGGVGGIGATGFGAAAFSGGDGGGASAVEVVSAPGAPAGADLSELGNSFGGGQATYSYDPTNA